MTTEQNNETIIRRFYDVYNLGHKNELHDLIASDYVDYGPGEPVHGLEGAKANVENFESGFDHIHFAINNIIAQGDAVAVSWTGNLRHVRPFFSLPATNKQVSFSGISMYRLRDGKIVETRVVQDVSGLIAQISPQA